MLQPGPTRPSQSTLSSHASAASNKLKRNVYCHYYVTSGRNRGVSWARLGCVVIGSLVHCQKFGIDGLPLLGSYLLGNVCKIFSHNSALSTLYFEIWYEFHVHDVFGLAIAGLLTGWNSWWGSGYLTKFNIIQGPVANSREFGTVLIL